MSKPLSKTELLEKLSGKKLKTEVFFCEALEADIEITELSASQQLEIGFTNTEEGKDKVTAESTAKTMLLTAAFGLGLPRKQLDLLENNPMAVVEIAKRVLDLSQINQDGEQKKS